MFIAFLKNPTYRQRLFQISSALETESYDETHFTVAISLPVSLTLRHHSICLHLSSKLEEFDEDDVIPIKQVSFIMSLPKMHLLLT